VNSSGNTYRGSIRGTAWPCVYALVLLLFGLAWCGPAWAYVVGPNEGVSFSQIDFTWEYATQYNSQYGEMDVDFDTLSSHAGFSTGYLNVYSDEGWIVQNVPIFPSSYGAISTTFDLGTSGDISSLDAYVDFSPDPVVDFKPTGSYSSFSVGDTEFNAEGAGSEKRTIPPGPPPKPGSATFTPGGTTATIVQDGHPNVEQYYCQCAPGAVANSFTWLKKKYGAWVPDDNVPGIDGMPPNSLPGQLDVEMGRVTGEGTTYEHILAGKLFYIEKYLAKGNPPITDLEHQGPVPTRSTGTVTSRNVGSKPTPEWILQKLREGEDVEVCWGWYEKKQGTWKRTGGHCVDLIGGGYTLGIPWVGYVEDKLQDRPGGTHMAFSLLLPTTLASGYWYLLNAPGINYIDFAMSESPEPTTPELPPGVLLVFSLLPVAWSELRRKKKSSQ